MCAGSCPAGTTTRRRCRCGSTRACGRGRTLRLATTRPSSAGSTATRASGPSSATRTGARRPTSSRAPSASAGWSTRSAASTRGSSARVRTPCRPGRSSWRRRDGVAARRLAFAAESALGAAWRARGPRWPARRGDDSVALIPKERLQRVLGLPERARGLSPGAKTAILFAVLALVVAIVALLDPRPSLRHVRVAMLSGSPSGNYYATVEKLAAEVARRRGRITNVASAGSVENIRRLSEARDQLRGRVRTGPGRHRLAGQARSGAGRPPAAPGGPRPAGPARRRAGRRRRPQGPAAGHRSRRQRHRAPDAQGARAARRRWSSRSPRRRSTSSSTCWSAASSTSARW